MQFQSNLIINVVFFCIVMDKIWFITSATSFCSQFVSVASLDKVLRYIAQKTPKQSYICSSCKFWIFLDIEFLFFVILLALKCLNFQESSFKSWNFYTAKIHLLQYHRHKSAKRIYTTILLYSFLNFYQALHNDMCTQVQPKIIT